MDRTIWIVQACVNVRGQVVDMFNGAYSSLEGARASLEQFARAQGKVLEWEGPGRLGVYVARIGEDLYTVAETALNRAPGASLAAKTVPAARE